ncbi:MAG TPA: ferrous iron transporter B, partial [Myxococcota bacterium]|nr:ferrous iron transporter B [Myxococcota bacterium]
MSTLVLVGRQNAGKTSLMMALTGAALRPVNFAGSSVERTEGHVKGHAHTVVDLPGVTSLEAVSPDEKLALTWLEEAVAEGAILVLVLDAGKLSVELALAFDLFRLKVPTVVALTKSDVAACKVDAAALEARLGVPVVLVNARTGEGRDALLARLPEARRGIEPTSDTPRFVAAEALARAVSSVSAPSPAQRFTDRVDKVVLHRAFGLPLFLLVVLGIFELLFVGADPLMGLIEEGQGALSGLVESAMDDGALRSLLIDGLINGVGSALVFLPQIIILILLIALLEASGYMARAAFLLDRVLSKVGLSGRSFVPMASAMACAVPGVLATRVIADERERLATIAVLPLMSCSARLPVYVILIGAFFPSSMASLVLLSLYLLGIVIAALVAWLLRRTRLKGESSLLLMELPVYQPPSLRVVWGQVKSATREFLVLAGTVIVATSVVIWALSYYPRPSEISERFDTLRAPITAAERGLPEGPQKAAAALALDQLDNAERAAYLEQSALADIGRAVQPVFALAGFDWRTTVGVVAAFPARELIIPTLGVLYSLGDVDAGTYDLAYLDAADETERDGLTAR